MDVPTVEAQPAETPPEDEPAVGEDSEIEGLEQRIEELEKQMTREQAEPEMPIVSQPIKPTKGQIDRHNATHAHIRRH